MQPRITVLLPLFNGEAHLRETLESVLGQTYRNFEILIIDDGSKDQGPSIAKSFGDPRIRLIQNQPALGLSASLNQGIREAQGEWIARMDADDICASDRFARQLAFLDSHPEINLLGTAIEIFGATVPRVIQNPLTHAGIAAELCFNAAFAHPTVFFRRSKFLELGLFYDPHCRRAEDYELWTRAISKVRCANLPEPLLRYRIHAAQASSASASDQKTIVREIRGRYLSTFGVSLDESETALLERISHWEFTQLRANGGSRPLETARTLYDRIHAQLRATQPEIAAEFRRRWARRFSISVVEAPLLLGWRRDVARLGWNDSSLLTAQEKRLFLMRGLLESWKPPLKHLLNRLR